MADNFDELDDAFCWMLSLAAWSAYQRVSGLLSGNMSPRQREDYDRLSNPEVGDLVVETSSLHRAIGWEDWNSLNRALGVLLEKGRHGGQRGAQTWTVLSLSPVPTWTYWENCSFVVVELPPFMPLCPHCKGEDPDACAKKRIPWHPDNEKNGYCAGGRWVYPTVLTKEKLTGALAGDGFKLKDDM